MHHTVTHPIQKDTFKQNSFFIVQYRFLFTWISEFDDLPSRLKLTSYIFAYYRTIYINTNMTQQRVYLQTLPALTMFLWYIYVKGSIFSVFVNELKGHYKAEMVHSTLDPEIPLYRDP